MVRSKMRFALLVFYAAGTLAVPVPDERTPKAVISVLDCKNTRFQAGTEFLYDYAGETINQVEGATKQYTSLLLTTRVSIIQGNNCEFKMKLQQSELASKSMNEKTFSRNPETQSFAMNVERYDLFFVMKSNKIQSLSPEDLETTEALNVKRGILSTLQLDEEATAEIDINGECPTTITKKDGKITKTKSLSDCSQRARTEVGIQSSSMKMQANLKPLDSKSSCTYSVPDGTIRTVDCTETHMFKPFSAGFNTPAGAVTTVLQKMRFVDYILNVRLGQAPNSLSGTKTLIFEHTSKDIKPAESINGQVEEVLKRLVDQSHLSVKQTSAHDFTALVKLFRKMDDHAVHTVWNKYFDCISSGVCGKNDYNLKDLYRQYMLDAISYCGTPSCVSIVKEATLDGDVTGERANMFLQSVAFVGKTTDSIIRDVLEIAKRSVETKKPSRQAFMTLGTLISRHCAKSEEDCTSSASESAKHFLLKTLKGCDKMADYQRVEEVLMTIKAIGNAKRPEIARSSLIACAMESKHSNVTIAAFDALRGMSCHKDTLDELAMVIVDKDVEDEKRIHAFRASVKCPTYDNLRKLVNNYNADTSDQVATFIWTYLTNLNESNNPESSKTKELLSSITKDTPMKLPELPIYRAASRNLDKYLYVDAVQSGVGVKANLIFNQDDVLPKTAMFDVNAKVMGVPMDLMETVVGVDGLESFLENVDIPNALDFNVFKVNLADKWREVQEKKEVYERIRRDGGKPVVKEKAKQLSGFMSLKVMGQDMRVMSYDDIQAFIEEIDNMNVIDLLSKIAHGGDKTFTKSLMFLEMTHTVPTGLGLPLRLRMTGSTVGSLELKGKFDMRNMFWGRGALIVNGLVKPSAVIDLSGQMGIESNYVTTGLMVSSNMIVSNKIMGSINYKAGQIFKVNVDTSEEPIHHIKVSSTPFMFMNGNADMIEGAPRMIKKDNCLKSEIVGLGLCTSIRLPMAYRDYDAPYFPLSGPAHFGVSVVRGDDKLKTIQFLVSMTKTQTALSGNIEFSTPGAKYERRLSGNMMYSDADNKKVLQLSAEPFGNGKTGSIEFSYDSISQSMSVQAKNNFFFSKDMIATVAFENQTNLISKQYGLVGSLQYDSYTLKHLTKYLKKPSGHMLVSTTSYAPNKALSVSLEYNKDNKKVTAIVGMKPFEQAFEVTGSLSEKLGATGLLLAAVHKPSMRNASLFAGYKGTESQKELLSMVTVGANVAKSNLLWEKDAQIVKAGVEINDDKVIDLSAALEDKTEKKTLKLSADVLGRKATLDAIMSNRESIKSLKLIANVLGKKAVTDLAYESDGARRALGLGIEALGKKATFDAILSNGDGLKSLEFVANVLGKEATLTTALRTDKQVLEVIANVEGRQATASIQLVNTPVEKSLTITVDVAGKTAATTLGYYREENSTVVKVACNVLQRHGELVWRLDSAQGYRSSLSFAVGEYVGGIRGVAGKDSGVCTSVYYGKSGVEKDAVVACINLNDRSTSGKMQKQLVYYVEVPALKKKVSLMHEVTKEIGLVTMETKTLFNEVMMSRQELAIDYRSLIGSSIKLVTELGKYNMATTLYTKKGEKGTVDFGVDVQIMSQSVSFLTQYEEVTIVDGKTLKVSSKAVVNGKTLPVETEIALSLGKSFAAPALKIKLAKYVLFFDNRITYETGKYGLSCSQALLKEEVKIFQTANKLETIFSQRRAALDEKFSFYVLGKTYTYGFKTSFEDQSDLHDTKYHVRSQVQYGSNRVSTSDVYLSNSKEKASVNVYMEYIQGKHVHHYVELDKERRSLRVSVELLPKIAVSSSVRLETKEGVQLDASATLTWNESSATVYLTSAFVNNENEIELFTRLNQDTKVSLKLTKSSPRTVAFVATLSGKKIVQFEITLKDLDISKVLASLKNLEVYFSKMFDRVDGDMSKMVDMLINADIDFSKTWCALRNLTIDISKIWIPPVKDLAKDITAAYEKFMKSFKLTLAGIKDLIDFDISHEGSKTIITVSVLKARYLKIILNRDDYSLNIQYKLKASLNLKYQDKSKSVTISVKTKSNRFGLILRADWNNKVASIFGVNNLIKVAGMKFYVDKNSFIAKMTLTPRLSIKSIFSYTDNTLRMEVQRSLNKTVTTEAVLEYVLGSKLSQLQFSWNKDTVEDVLALLRPTIAKIKLLLDRVLEDYAVVFDKVIEISNMGKTEFLRLLNAMDKAFDEIDFVAVRDDVGKSIVSGLKKVSAVFVESLKTLANELDTLNKRLPGYAQSLKELVKKAKIETVIAKVKQIVRDLKAKELLTNIKELIAEVKKMIKTVRADLEEKINEIRDITSMVVKNITDASKPVADKTLSLLNDFEIRGKRMEEIIEISQEYIKKAKAILIKLKADAIIRLKELRVIIEDVAIEGFGRLMDLEVPYANMTVAQVVRLVRVKLDKTMEMILNLDVKEVITKVEKQIMEMKIQGKPVSEYVALGKKKLLEMKNEIQTFLKEGVAKLPEIIRKLLHKLVAVSRESIKQLNVYKKIVLMYINKLSEFAKPLNTYLNLVQTSVVKNVKPLYDDISDAMIAELKKIPLPSLKSIIDELKKGYDFVLPLVEPLEPLYRELMHQLKDIRIEGVRVGPFIEKKIEELDGKIMSVLAAVGEKIETLAKDIERLENMAADELVDLSVDSTVEFVNKIVAYLRKLYTEREELVEKIMKDVKQRLEDLYEKIPDITAEAVIDYGTKTIETVTAELSSVLKQLADLDVANPLWQVWTDADVIGHLEKYGVNEKIAQGIKWVKDVNITTLLLDTIETAKTSVLEAVATTVEVTLRTYLYTCNKVTKVIEYIRSIPTKDYAVWVRELEEFSTMSKQMLTKKLNVVYSRLLEVYDSVKVTVMADTEKLYNQTVAVAETLRRGYDLVAGKAEIIYDDLKQPTIDVFKHYKDVVVPFIQEQAEIVVAECKKIYEKVKAMTMKLSSELADKFEEIKAKATKAYDDFMAMYGNMTWEEVADEVEKVYLKQYDEILAKYRTVKVFVDAQYKAVSKYVIALKTEITEKALKLYKEVVEKFPEVIAEVAAEVITKLVELKKYVNEVYSEVKPKLIAVWTKYEKLVQQESEALIAQAKVVYNDAKVKVLEIYDDIKSISIKEVVAKIQKDVVPQLMAEIESIVNQTLRNTVIISKEIIKAYTPHATLIKEAFEKEVLPKIKLAISKVKSLVEKIDVEKVKELVKEAISKVQKKVNELIKKIKTNDKYIKMVEKTLELKKLVEDKLQEIKKSPVVIKITDDIKKVVELIKDELKVVISQLKESIGEKIDEFMKSPVVVSIRSAIDEAIPIVKNITVAVQKNLAQMKKSGQFSVEKLQEILKADVVEAIDIAKGKLLKAYNKILERIQKVAVDFEQFPEETFWKELSAAKQALVDISASLRSVNWEQVVAVYKTYSNKIVTYSKQLVTKCTDQWTKDVAMKLYTQVKEAIAKLEDIFRKMPALMKEFYNEALTSTKQMVDRQVQAVITFWKNSTYKSFVIAVLENPLWSDLAKEIKDHELLALGKELVKLVSDELFKLYEENKDLVEKKFAVLKTWVEEKYKTLRNETVALYEKAAEEYKKLIKIYDETTTAEVVDYLQKKFKELKEKANALYEKYEPKVKEILKIVEGYVKAYEVELKQYYQNITRQVLDLYKKYRPIIEEEYKKLLQNATAIYNKLKGMIDESYKATAEKIQELVITVKSKINAEYEKLVAVWMKSSLREKLVTLKKMTIAETLEALKELPSKVKNYIVTLGNGLIADFDKLLNDAVIQIKDSLKEVADKVKSEIVRLMAQYEDQYKWLVNEVRETAIFVRRYYNLDLKYKLIKAFVIKTWELTVVEAKAVVQKAKEFALQVPTVLKQYADEYIEVVKKMMVKIQIKAEALLEKIKKKIPLISEALEKLLKDYKELITAVKVFIEQVANVAGDEVLRGVHAGLKKAVSLEKDIKGLVAKLREGIAVTIDGEAITIAISHPEITPSFRRLAKVTKEYMEGLVKKISEKVLELKASLTQYIKDLKEKLMKEGSVMIKAIKSDALALKASVEKFTEKVIEELPAVISNVTDYIQDKLACLKDCMDKYVKMIKEKGQVAVSDVTEFVKYEAIQISKCIKVVEAAVLKAEQTLKELKTRIVNSETYIKLVASTKTQLAALKKFIEEKLEELKTNPTLIEIQAYVTKAVSELKVKATELLNKFKEEVPAIVAKVEKVIDTIKEKAPVMFANATKFIKDEVEKVNEMIRETIAKVTQKLTALYEGIVKSEMFIKLVEFAEEKLAALRKFIKERVEELKTNPTLIKIGSQISNMTIDAIADVTIMGVELVKKIDEQIVVLKAKVKEYISIVKEKAPIMIANATKFVKDEFAKIQEKTLEALEKVQQKLEDILKRLVESETYTKIAEFVKKQLAALKKLVKEKVEELNPILIKIRSQITNVTEIVVNELETKGAELWKKVKEEIVVLKARVEKYIEIIKEKAPIMIANATKFIKDEVMKARKIVETVVTKLQQGLKDLKEEIVKSEIYIKITEFVKAQLAALKKFVKEQIDMLKNDPTLLAIIAKIKEVIKTVEEAIKNKIEVARKEFPVIVKKIETFVNESVTKVVEFVKTTITKVEKKVKDLVDMIKKDERFIELKEKLEQVKEFLRLNFEKLMKNELVQKIIVKGEELINMTKAYAKEYVALLKKELPKVVATINDMYNKVYNKSVAFIGKIVNGFEQTWKDMVKWVEEKIEELMKNPTVQSIKAKVLALVAELKDRTSEIRKDILLSYNANKNITMRLYQDTKIALTPYYVKAIDIFSRIATYLENVKSLSDVKLVVEDAIKETMKAVKLAVEQMKKEVVQVKEALKPYYDALKITYMKIKAGDDVRKALESLVKEILEVIDDELEGVCNSDPKLCQLVRDSWTLHNTLLKKYMSKIPY